MQFRKARKKLLIVNVLHNQNLINYKVGERGKPKKFKYYKSYTKKHILYEKKGFIV